MDKVAELLAKLALGAIDCVCCSLIMGLPIMWLWNAVLVETTGVSEIGYLQACGLYAFVKMFTGIIIK